MPAWMQTGLMLISELHSSESKQLPTLHKKQVMQGILLGIYCTSLPLRSLHALETEVWIKLSDSGACAQCTQGGICLCNSYLISQA